MLCGLPSPDMGELHSASCADWNWRFRWKVRNKTEAPGPSAAVCWLVSALAFSFCRRPHCGSWVPCWRDWVSALWRPPSFQVGVADAHLQSVRWALSGTVPPRRCAPLRPYGESLDRGTNLDRHRSRHVGFVFQSYYLLPNLTSSENVQIPMMASPRRARGRQQRSIELLRWVGLSERVDHLPDQLSSGQRQRVAIARALANSPEILLADEPTGALDSETGAEIVQLLGRLNRQNGITLLIVTHDHAVADMATRVLEMSDGRVTERIGRDERA